MPAGQGFEALNDVTASLAPLAESEADEAERQFHLTDKLIDAYRKTGLYAFMVPEALGGPELSWVDGMKLVEKMSHADGAAGWCLMVQGVMTASYGAFVPDGGVEPVFGNGPDVTIAGHGVPRGYARPVEGGYQISGTWSYGSGITHAEWIHTGCFVMDGDDMRMDADGHPVVVLCHHPRDSIKLTGNWDAHGLRGSGSYDYALTGDDLFVPDEFCYLFDNPPQQRGGIQYSDGLVVSTTWGHTSWALGVGRRVLDELAAMSHHRADLFGEMHASPTFRQKFAEAEAKYRAARALVYDSWNSLCDSYAGGETGNLEQLAMIRLAMRHLHDVISENSTFAHKTARGVAIRPSVLQRCYRDIHTGTQHILMADELVQECAKVLLGTTTDKAFWTLFGVVDG